MVSDGICFNSELSGKLKITSSTTSNYRHLFTFAIEPAFECVSVLHGILKRKCISFDSVGSRIVIVVRRAFFKHVGNCVSVYHPVRIKRNVGIFRVRAAHDIAIYILPAILCVARAGERCAGEFKRHINCLRTRLNFARNSFAFTRQIGNRVRLQSPTRIEGSISISSVLRSKINFFVRSRINPAILFVITFAEECLARHIKIVAFCLDVIGTFARNAFALTRQIGNRVGNNPMRIENQVLVVTIRCANIIR